MNIQLVGKFKLDPRFQPNFPSMYIQAAIFLFKLLIFPPNFYLQFSGAAPRKVWLHNAEEKNHFTSRDSQMALANLT